MSHAPVTAVIFDYGKVLSMPPTQAQWDRLAGFFGATQDLFQKQYWGHRDAYDRDEFRAAGYWRAVAKDNGKDVTDAEVEQLIEWDNEQWTNLNPEMLELSRRLRAGGVRTAILSNMQAEMLAYMRRKFGWLDEFEVQMYSCDVGMVKPVREIYLKCCAELGSRPENTLFLDDKMPNIQGALHAGLQALLFEGNRTEVEEYLAARV